MSESGAERKGIDQVLIGDSPPIQAVIRAARKIAASKAMTTLVIGDSGTGKELVARLVHMVGSYANQPFVDINCGAIPNNLLESELFGYEKGAFTGAQERKKGLFELAHGGTIFLDEIGTTDHNFQVKLLKAVENKRFRRIGGIEEIEISTRIIAASNVDLYDLVQKGRFREDLYYRLNVGQIYIPPLRERGRDVILIANYFIERLNERYQCNIRGLTSAAEKVLMDYAWPGNVRQLKNVIERTVLLEARDWIEPEHLLLDTRQARPAPAALNTTGPALDLSAGVGGLEFPEGGICLESVEKALILGAMEKAGGNLSRAARLLRIPRGKLRYRLQKLEG